MMRWQLGGMLIVWMGLVACGQPEAAELPLVGAVAEWRTEPVRLAFVGDYGVASEVAATAVPLFLEGKAVDPRAEGDVAALVRQQRPHYIFTSGDNNYPAGEAATLDDNVGQFYSDFIAPYRGRFGLGARVNRFFPALGNHDWEAPGAGPHLDYFSLPNNGRYYDVPLGPVHLFVVDSDAREPDGIEAHSRQYAWFKERIKHSTARYKIVTLHHPPYNSSKHQDPRLRWPFAKWGVNAVVAGHHHVYERFDHDGIPYVVNGAGGAPLAHFGRTEAGSVVQYNEDYGALFAAVTNDSLSWQFIDRRGRVVDAWAQ